MMLGVVLTIVVLGSFMLGKYQERAQREYDELEALRRLRKR